MKWKSLYNFKVVDAVRDFQSTTSFHFQGVQLFLQSCLRTLVEGKSILHDLMPKAIE